jgi:MYXO-CTERM domain-containing protein
MHRITRSGLMGCVAAAIGAGLLAQGATAATTTYTSRSSFESSLPAGNYFNNFNGTTPTFAPIPGGVSGTGGTPSIGYTITAPTAGVAAFPDAGFTAIGNWGSSNNVVVALNTGNVFSAGADIWLSDINGNRLAGTITVNYSDGSSVLVPSTTTGAFGFAGITTDSAPLTSMTVVGLGGSSYLNMSNLSVAVPEPSSIVLAVMGTAGLAAAAARCRRRHG